MGEKSYLYTSNLTIGYDDKILLSNLNININRGDMICLLGPNGVGKSTLINTLTATLSPLSGSILLDKKPINKIPLKELSQLISIVLTKKLSSANLTVFDLVAMGRIPYTNWLGNLTKKDIAIVEKSMKLVNVDDFYDRQIDSLSDGEKQRVLIAKALAQDTPLIILDEPTAHLDVANRVALLSLLKKLAKETKKSILLSTHELEMAIQVADQIWLIDNHKQLHKGTPEDLALSGVFGNTFKGEQIKFDMNTGAFKMQHSTFNKIKLNGTDPLIYWTKQALEKEGYQIVSDGETQIEVSFFKEPNMHWIIKTVLHEIRVESIEELINKIINDVEL